MNNKEDKKLLEKAIIGKLVDLDNIQELEGEQVIKVVWFKLEPLILFSSQKLLCPRTWGAEFYKAAHLLVMGCVEESGRSLSELGKILFREKIIDESSVLQYYNNI